MEQGDLSPLVPMSRKDLIWVRIALQLKQEREFEEKKNANETEIKKFQLLYFLLADLRSVSLDTNAFARLAALKGGKKPKIDLFDVTTLPSKIAEKEQAQKEYEERRAKMTEEERRAEDVRSFMEGKKYKPRG